MPDEYDNYVARMENERLERELTKAIEDGNITEEEARKIYKEEKI